MAGNGANGPSKKDRRETARETARIMREEAAKKARRRKFYLQGGIGVGVLVVLAVVALVIVNSVGGGGSSFGPKNMASNGIFLTGKTTTPASAPAIKANAKPTSTNLADHSGTANITVYLDYQCPYCNQFETTNATQIGQWVDAGIATLEIHPISILDASSNGHRYSSRAANAAACVANYKPSTYFAVNSALFANQPAEQTNGLTNDKILSILKGAGASSKTITDCVNNETYKSWVTNETKYVLNNPVPNSTLKAISSTPTILVNGQQYQGTLTDATTFQNFVSSVMSGATDGGTSTPSTTPQPGSTAGQ